MPETFPWTDRSTRNMANFLRTIFLGLEYYIQLCPMRKKGKEIVFKDLEDLFAARGQKIGTQWPCFFEDGSKLLHKPLLRS